MVTAIKQNVTVQAGGLIEVRSPELKAGDHAKVIVLVESSTANQSSLSSFRGAAKSLYADAQAVDNFLRSERDAWDR